MFVEKKAFERLLDEHVAAGMDKSVQVLINQCEYILLKEQLAVDYNPAPENEGKIFDLLPTKVRKPLSLFHKRESENYS